MRRTVVQTEIFSRCLDELIRQRKITVVDYENFERALVENPKSGDVIPGLSGLRKIRFKGNKEGKRGGYRIDYLDMQSTGQLFLIVIYPKKVKEELSQHEKRQIKKIVESIKEREERNG